MSSLAIRKDCDCKDAPRLHIFMRAGSQTWLTRPPRHVARNASCGMVINFNISQAGH